MTDILELIDNAIEGSTSVDAMRWTPDPPGDGQGMDDLGGWTYWVGISDMPGAWTTSGVSPADFTVTFDTFSAARSVPVDDEFAQHIAAQVCAAFGVPPALVGVRLCGKHWLEYRRLVAEQAAKRVRLRRMHSAYHARKR